MESELESCLQECIVSLGNYETPATNDIEGWVEWMSCTSHFLAGEYLQAAQSAAKLLADRSLPKWFPPFQILLISLLHTAAASDRDDWISRLVKAAPFTDFQINLVWLASGKTNLESILPKARSDENRCQSYYYLGEYLLFTGETGKALAAFQKSAAFDVRCVEHQFAQNRSESLAKLSPGRGQGSGFSLVTKHWFVPTASTKDKYEQWLRRGSGEQLLSLISKLLAGDEQEQLDLLVDANRYESVSRLIHHFEQIKIQAVQKSDDDYQWLPNKVRHALADVYKDVFLEQIRSISLVESSPFLENFQLIEGAELLSFSKLPRCQDIRTKLRSYKEIDHSCEKYFVSHRWLSTEQPDPTGIQMRLLKKVISPQAYYWIDYCCLPQEPRSASENVIFSESMKWLPSLLFNMNVIVVRCHDDGYFERAWCFFEMLAANVIGRSISYISEEDHVDSNYRFDERKVLEQTLVNMDLPEGLAARPSDLEILKKIVQNVAFFFKLQVVWNYMSLGQDISGEGLFWGEDPYYFMAVCDFSQVMLWLFDRARESGKQLVELSSDRSLQDFLTKLAEKEYANKIVKPYSMAKKVALDENRLAWFYANLDTDNSMVNLFYRMTAMIE